MRLDAAPTIDSGPKKKGASNKQVAGVKKKSNEEDYDVIKASQALRLADQHFTSAIEQPFLGTAVGMQPDPLLLVALHASRPRLLSLDDLLAARCVCKAWKQRLGTAFCHSIRIPHSMWHEAANPRLAAAISAAAAAYPHASTLLLDSGGCRPGLQPNLWTPLLDSLQPWLVHSNNSNVRCIHLRLGAPPSPKRLDALQCLDLLTNLQIHHTMQSLYSRHVSAIAQLTQLQSLVLLLKHPKLHLRSLGHQRLRHAPLKMDCLSSLVGLTQLDLCSTGPSGELLADTVASFSSPASLAALSNLRCLSISEAALPGPQSATDWLQPLSCLTQLQLVQRDEPGKGQGKGRGSSTGTAACAGSAASGLAGSLFGAGGFGALAAAAAAAGRGSAAEQLLQQQQQQLLQQQGVLPNLLSSAGSGSYSRTGHTAAMAAAVAGFGAHQLPGGDSVTLTNTATGSVIRAGSISSTGSEADFAAGSSAPAGPSLPPLNVASALPNLSALTVANLAGERLIQLKIPSGLSRLALHLASPCPGSVTGEQLAAVVLQTAQTLVSLELGLGMRFSLSGGVMRGLKRGLKGLKDLVLIEGAHDHLEGLGCWCNLRRLELVEGRCSAPLRGLYELSMRAAMGRTPGVLRYTGHVRHVDELAGRLGGALKELRLDSLSGFGSVGARALSASSSGCMEGDVCSSTDAARGTESSLTVEVDGQVVPQLHHLSSLTRLEIVGDRVGQLEVGAGLAIANLKSLVVLEIIGQEPWLLPELGVKEQLVWLRSMTQLRQLRLSGLMLGRSRLAGTTSNSNSSTSTAVASAAMKADKAGSSSSSRSSSSSSKAGALAPAVKGLGNGLASNSAVGGSRADAVVVKETAGAMQAGPVLNPAAAAARDLAVAMALEEVRRWLCQLLPYCRVWLD